MRQALNYDHYTLSSNIKIHRTKCCISYQVFFLVLKYVKFTFHIYLNNYLNNIIIILACDAILIHYSNYKEAKDV